MKKLRAGLLILYAQIVKVWPNLKKLFAKLVHFTHQQGRELARKFEKDQSRRQLTKLPWYLLLGTPQSGKKHLLAHSGLYFMQPENFGTESTHLVEEVPDVDWWFSEQAVIVDAMSQDKTRDLTTWQQLIKVFKKLRPHQPVNGIILTFSLPDVLKYTPTQRQAFLQDACKYIRDLHQEFSVQVPVYLMLTKCDLLEGFMEFFNDLSKEELSQIWGMTLPFLECHDATFARKFFHEAFINLINTLRDRVLWSLDTERTMRGRELIHSFPQQLQLFKQPLDQLIAELFAAARLPHIIKLRGLYFTSSTQTQEPIDFLMQAMSKKFQLVPPQNDQA